MIERLIEHWLTSANERAYEIPFRQMLSAKGFSVFHQSGHGMMEQGKDILAFDPDGRLCAYQLKTGNIDLTEWRKIRGEVEELVEIPVKHPSARGKKNHRAFLVANGELSDPVRREIDDRNQRWKSRKEPILETILYGQLLADFKAVHDQFLPRELSEFRTLLELYLSDPRGTLSEEQYSQFLTGVLPYERPIKRDRDYKRAFSSALLLNSCILAGYREKHNHIAQINAWILLLCHILGIGEKYNLPEKHWRESVDLCLSAVEDSFMALVKELEGRDDLIEGSPVTDAPLFRARMTIVAGYLSAYDLYLTLRNDNPNLRDRIYELISKHSQVLELWGESAVPLLVMLALHREQRGNHIGAESVLDGIIRSIIDANLKDNQKGIPSPYYSLEDVVLARLGDRSSGTFQEEDFGGKSFTLEALVEMLARRNRRQALKLSWKSITRLSYCEFLPASVWATYLWRSKNGEQDSRLPNKPESWSALVKRANTVSPGSTPRTMLRNPHIAPLFLICYPHRFSAARMTFLEESLAAAGRR